MSLLMNWKYFFQLSYWVGYVKYHSQRMYWEWTADTRNEAVSNVMTRDRFDEIMIHIYCYDPEEAEGSEKVRLLIEKRNERFLK